jgi:2'-5' RNA ligase
VRAQLAAWRDGWHWPAKATPVCTDKLHLTLHFMGEVKAPESLDVRFPAFDLSFGHNTLWPHGVAILEPDTIPAPLLALQHDLGMRLQACSIALDTRAYKPHVTLARRAASATPVSDGPAFTWHVDRYALVSSQGGNYEVVREYSAC